LAAGATTVVGLPALPLPLLGDLDMAAPGFGEAFLADEADKSLAGVFPATRADGLLTFLATFAAGFLFATGFTPRRDGDFFAVRADVAKVDFFFAGFVAAAFGADGLPGRFGARDAAAARWAAAFEGALAFVFNFVRDLFAGFEAFMTMVVLLLGCHSSRDAPLNREFSRDWGDSGKLQIITCA
jgi:hypothetical protein